MAGSRGQDFVDGSADQFNGEDFTDSSDSHTGDAVSPSLTSAETLSVGSDRVLRTDGGAEGEIGLVEPLMDVFLEGGDGDLLLQLSDREDRVLQWLQALDMQVMGACRADERLKPLLKMNVSSGLAEDRFLAHLSQHFEPSEVGMLARCFCIPLVSIRVGQINKQGTLLLPTATRGSLSLALLPTSDLRLSFIGDNGQTERLFTFSSKSQCSSAVIEHIPADNSGRSFLIKLPDGKLFYYWCSEKAKLLGIELLLKMKDLIKRKPSIAELTGISESRLGYFATHLRVYLMGSAVGKDRGSSSGLTTQLPVSTANLSSISSASTKSLRTRHSGCQPVKANSLNLSPRLNSFKEGMSRSLRTAAREKLRRRGDNHLSAPDSVTVACATSREPVSHTQRESEKLPDDTSCPQAPSFLESMGKLSTPPTLNLGSRVASLDTPLFSPYYCWCPLGASSLQQSTTAPPQCPSASIEFPLLPPLSSLLSGAASHTLFAPTPPLNLTGIPSLDFPPLLPDPLVRLPIPTSQQIPTFTPLICDPIVHIPVIDVCSSGQGYLVSAGPAISTTIPPLHPSLVSTGLPESDSVVDKGARETLRLLISSSSQTNPPLMDVLPSILKEADNKRGILVMGSRGLYSGTRDVNAIVNGMAAMGLVTPSRPSGGEPVTRRCTGDDNVKAVAAEGSDGCDKSFADMQEEGGQS